MKISQARRHANRQNSEKSTGPVSDSGKERSRQNNLKQGMTGKGIVLSPEMRDAVDHRVATLQVELNPKTALGVILLRQIATLSIRMERGATHEFAAVASRVRHAPADFDRSRVERAEALFATLADDPRGRLEQLRSFPEGIARLLRAWDEFRVDLSRHPSPLWSLAHFAKMTLLLGLSPDWFFGTRLEALSKASHGNFVYLEDSERAGMEPLERRVWAARHLLEKVEAEIASLQSHLATLDFANIELDRREAADRALFDHSKEAALARRYESEARRGFFKALAEFRNVEDEAAELRDCQDDAEREAMEMASSGEEEVVIDDIPRPQLKPHSRVDHLTQKVGTYRPMLGSETRRDSSLRPVVAG